MVAAGVPALALLAVCSALGPFLGGSSSILPILTDADEVTAKIVKHSVTAGITAIVFWVWAVYHCVYSHFDLGAVTYLLVMIAAAQSWRSVADGGSKMTKKAMVAACLSVAANFVLALALIHEPWTLVLYFVVSLLWWIAAAACCPSYPENASDSFSALP
eukprot:TRINITY_DN72528_c0_g1_i1.p1 TRINITY_DN72528_c0_g1~~TRINITY_DN72528_c0_g1_i1.p1  ORF type:complete len:160 (+),score=30.48 TRINITY_DN72528_c0_g1_i1:57-536(+)